MSVATSIAPSIINWLDLFGIAVFAVSGALAAAKRQQTLVTFAFFALVTGVGGGTVRDLLIGAPVFWVHDWAFPATCLAISAIVWVTPVALWNERALDWFDAVGMAIYSVFGAWKALSLGIGPLPAMMMGVITACVGGIIRDLCHCGGVSGGVVRCADCCWRADPNRGRDQRLSRFRTTCPCNQPRLGDTRISPLTAQCMTSSHTALSSIMLKKHYFPR
jgi:hypothetical protein